MIPAPVSPLENSSTAIQIYMTFAARGTRMAPGIIAMPTDDQNRDFMACLSFMAIGRV